MARPRESGAVYRRGRTWWIWYRTPEGERVYESAETADKREAQALLAQRRRELRDGTWSHPRDRESSTATLTVARYLERWIERRRAAGVRNVSDEALWINEHVTPVIGSMPLASVKRTHLRDLVVALGAKKSERTGRPYAPRTILHVYRTLVTAFSDAVLDSLIPSSPCTLRTRKGELPKLRDADPKWRARAVYEREEAETLLSSDLPLDRRVLYGLMLCAGLRFSEAAAVRWAAYDRTAQPLGRLTVETQADGATDERETKTGETRDVPVIPALAALLAEWRAGFVVRFGYEPRPEDPIVPATTSKGRVYRFRSTSGAYESLVRDLAKLELRRVPALRHSMRATFLTLLEADGANMAIARRATHAAPSDVVAGYVRTSWADLCREVAKLRVSLRQRRVVVPFRRAASAEGCDSFCDSPGDGTKRPGISRAVAVGDTGVEPVTSTV